jgi:hypothetical protein
MQRRRRRSGNHLNGSDEVTSQKLPYPLRSAIFERTDMDGSGVDRLFGGAGQISSQRIGMREESSLTPK